MKLEAERAYILILNWASKQQTASYFFPPEAFSGDKSACGYFVSFSFLFVLFRSWNSGHAPHSTVLSKSLGLSHGLLDCEG